MRNCLRAASWITAARTTAIKAKQAQKNQSKIETGNEVPPENRASGTTTRRSEDVLLCSPRATRSRSPSAFRGRGRRTPEQGLTILERLADDLKDIRWSSKASRRWKAATCTCSSPASRKHGGEEKESKLRQVTWRGKDRGNTKMKTPSRYGKRFRVTGSGQDHVRIRLAEPHSDEVSEA